jgi:hypothetical protein
MAISEFKITGIFDSQMITNCVTTLVLLQANTDLRDTIGQNWAFNLQCCPIL